MLVHAGDLPGEFAGFAGLATNGPDGYRVELAGGLVTLKNDGSPVVSPTTARLLLHEFAHILDMHAEYSHPSFAGSGVSESPAWRRAMSESPCAVSDYATTNAQEDFAESVVAWFLFYAARVPHHVEDPEDWRYRRYLRAQRQERATLRRDYKRRLGRRFGVLNRAMHARYVEPSQSVAPPTLAVVVERIPLADFLGVQR